ncbi:hypothetical protein PMI14_04349 [Acidovorax sp. CF316]|nr:hypothetical protein PMI14_04349 [Acidovorax sp. CF316]
MPVFLSRYLLVLVFVAGLDAVALDMPHAGIDHS